MNAVSLGPLVFSTERLHVIAALAVFLAAIELSEWLWPSRAGATRHWSWIALLGWVTAARTGFVLANLDAFATDPLTVLALWQGGFSGSAGVFGLGLVGVFAMLRRPEALRPVALAVACAGVTFSAANWALPVEVRGQLPQIALPDLDGREIALAETNGRPVIINLWATWCPPCRRELPMMMGLKNSRDDVVMLFVNQGENRATIQRYLESQGLDVDAVVQDRDSRLMSDFALLGLPSTLFFSADGRLLSVHTGEISRAALTNQMNELSQETK